MKVDNLEFKPVVQFYTQGNETQRCKTKYKEINITWETFFPYNIFKKPIDTFLVDRIVSAKLAIPGAIINENHYTDKGFGYPEFKTLKDAITYIDSLP